VEFKSSLAAPILSEGDQNKLKKLKELKEYFEKKDNQEAVKAKKVEIDNIKNSVTRTIIKHAAMKTIAAFANTDGGTLIIGVNDNKELIGLESDYKHFSRDNKQDELKKYFDNTVNDFFRNISTCLKEINPTWPSPPEKP
jgi:predicted HTH transcriptional regulator